VKNGTIKQSQEDAILQRITSGPEAFSPGRGGFGHRFGPHASPTP
jgi:hypothetical protein